VKQKNLCRMAATFAVAVLLAEGFHADDTKLHGVWQLKDGSQLNFRGQKVAATVITDDTSLQMSGEEALVRELTSRGVTGVATYRIAPKEELKSAEKARPWFDKAGVAGVVALRPVAVERVKTYSPVVWASGYYQSYWGYYDYGWMNVGKVRAKGIELAMQVTDWQGFDVNLAWTWTDATNQLTGKRLARRPEHTLAASLDYHWPFGLVTGIDLNHAGERYDDTANTQLVPDYATLGLRASYPLTPRVELFGRVENALDAVYEVVRTYGTPRRSAYAGVRARF